MALNPIASVHTEPGMFGRQAERFVVNRPARFISVGIGLMGISIRSCQLLDISKVGASFHVRSTLGLPDHYFMNIIGTADRIGCAEIFRSDDRVGVRFIKSIDDSLLSDVIRDDFFTR